MDANRGLIMNKRMAQGISLPLASCLLAGLIGCSRSAEAPTANVNSNASASSGSAAASEYTYEGGYPTSETVTRAKNESDLDRAVTAYRFWYPAISTAGIFAGLQSIGLKVNDVMAILSAGPRQIAYTANSDTPYGVGAFDLSKTGPLVVELPPGPFIALADDHYQGWIMDMGLPGPDAGQGGKHLILPPGSTEQPPAGYYVGRSSSNTILIAIRSIPPGGDLAAAMDALKKIKIYPLSSAANPNL